MTQPKRHLITCALPYANGPLHIGHIAGCFLPSDIYVRHLKNEGKEVLFVCGTDEHGVPITIKAQKEGVTPQEVVDRNYEVIKSSLEAWGIEFDNFSRTSRPIHHETAKDFFRTLYDKGVFVEQVTEQFYDAEAKQFLADRYIVGECPNCGFHEAYGDQCENCGRTLSPRELINPKSALTGNMPVIKETKNWFLPLDQLQDDFLNDWVETKKDVWKSHVYGQCKSWLNDGLKPRAMTRDLDWGVPVPIDGADGKVMYVWFDAPIGYISATKEIRDDWEQWWKNDETELTHFLGKDNIVFHTIIFPSMLHAHGGFNLPQNVPANEFLNLEGQKLSTSRNHAVWLHEYLEDFPNREDELRYVLTSIMPESKDSDFSWSDFQARVNNELVAILGNWVNRVLILNQKYFGGVVPAHSTSDHAEILEEANTYITQAKEHIENFRFRDGLSSVMSIARLGNKFLQDSAPWHAIKEEGGKEKVEAIIAVSIALLARFGEACRPFLPRTADKLSAMIKSENGSVKAGVQLDNPSLLFEKVEDEQMEIQVQKLANKGGDKKMNYEAIKDIIQFEDFAKLDLRVGTILEATKVPKADKLLQLLVDIGSEKRTILSGIAMHFNPEDLVGKQAVVVCNLAPRKMRGVESNGMLLMAENHEEKLVFVAPKENIEPGSIVR